jgi:hypothetical protein
MRGSAVFRVGVAPGGALAPSWVRDSVSRAARSTPSLDLRFADNKSLIDATSGQSLVTFTRASSGTFVGSDGLIKTATTNLLLRSEEFDNASWTKVRATVSANTIAAPNGTLSADTGIEDTSASATHNPLIQDATIIANGTYTASLYVKTKERSRGDIWFSSTDSANYVAGSFNLGTGTILATSSGTGSGAVASIANVGDGWYRVSITGSIGSSLTTGRLVLRLADGTGSIVYTGNGTSGLYLWGAQLEQSSTVGEYIPTTSTINSAPRFDHNPTTGESLGLLVEEQRTNSITNNTMVGAVAGTPGTNPTGWVYATAQSNGLTISIAGAGVENGINYIDYRFNGTTVASPSACAIGIVNATAATAQTWTASTYWKLAAGSTTGTTNWQLGLIENTAGGAFVTGAFYSQTAPTSAALITQRPTATRTLSGGGTVGVVTLPINITVAGNTAIDFTLRIGMPQLEQGAFATSVIPTSTATVTRSADVASITGANFSSWFNASQSTIYSEAASSTGAAYTGYVYTVGASFNDSITHYRQADSQPVARIRTASADEYGATGNGAIWTGTGVNKFALGVSATSGRQASNGQLSSGGDDTSIVFPSMSSMTLGGLVGGSFLLNGTIRRLTYWPSRLANSTLQEITR